nr:FAD binding domain-containing protein [uncultured Merdimonas sp.]
MLKIKNYVKAESLEQAYELNQKKSNRILGGMLWMKMSSAQIQTAIDLSGLGLDTIEETDEAFRIGCMATLRQLELHEGMNQWFQGMIRDSVKDIVGVQFRNLATVGGSIFGRFGFSDVLTCFLALDTEVELFKRGVVPLEEFVKMPRDRDILVRIIVKKTKGRYAYLSHRNAKTDFPVLAVGLALLEKGIRVTVGAGPKKAMRIELPEMDVERAAKEAAGQVPTESNMRGSGEYRSHLAEVLIRRGLTKLQEGGGKDED